METHLEIAVRLKYLTPMDIAAIDENTTRLGRRLTALRASLNRRIDQMEATTAPRVNRSQNPAPSRQNPPERAP